MIMTFDICIVPWWAVMEDRDRRQDRQDCLFNVKEERKMTMDITLLIGTDTYRW